MINPNIACDICALDNKNVLEPNSLGFKKVLDRPFERVGIVLGYTNERIALVDTIVFNSLA